MPAAGCYAIQPVAPVNLVGKATIRRIIDIEIRHSVEPDQQIRCKFRNRCFQRPDKVMLFAVVGARLRWQQPQINPIIHRSPAFPGEHPHLMSPPPAGLGDGDQGFGQSATGKIDKQGKRQF